MACDQPWTVPLLLKILVSGPPVLCTIASLLFLHRYHINEKDRAEIAEKLRLLRYSKIYNVTFNDEVCFICRRNSGEVESYTASGSSSLYGTSHSDCSTLKGEIHHSNH